MNLRLDKIVPEVSQTVRFKQVKQADLEKLDADLVSPSSARLSFHPLFTDENLSYLAPNFKQWTPVSWDATTIYYKEEVVLFNGVIYECIADESLNEEPASFSSVWLKTNFVSNYLRDLRKEATRRLITEVWNNKKNERYTKEYLDHLSLYTGTGRIQDKIVKQGRLIGYEIHLLDNVNIEVVLDRLMIHFDTAQQGIELYLFHSSQAQAIATITVDQEQPARAEWKNLDPATFPSLKYENFDQDLSGGISGGSYYLMYDENQIVGQAINHNYNIGVRPCKSCNRYNYMAYDKYSQYIRIHNVSIAETKRPLNVTDMFDVDDLSYPGTQTFGLNLQISTYCDLTQFAIDRKGLFADALCRQVTVDLLRELASSARNNAITEKLRNNARQALQNTELGGENVMEDLKKAKDALSFEFSNLQNSVCMPKIESKGVQVKGIRAKGGYGTNYGNSY